MGGGGGPPGAGGMPGMPGVSEAEAKSMKAFFDAMTSGDPELKKQMEGYWKMLDNMNESDPEGYKKFIDGQMKEMKDDHK